MTATVPPLAPDLERDLLAAARGEGFCLFQCELSTGRLVWEWRRVDGPRPQFVTRRVALHWMAKFLGWDTGFPPEARGAGA